MALAAEPQVLYKTSHTREKLEEFIVDYNGMYSTAFSTKDGKQFENYFKDISKRLKEREKVGFKAEYRLDIVLVVNMFLTGFDAKKVNTLYVDKNLKQHGLIQTFSRTNRILDEKKSHGEKGFEGGINAKKYIGITKTSKATATKDLQDLQENKIISKKGQGRSTTYILNLQ